MTKVALRELMRIHIDTLYTHDERGRIVRVNEPDGAPAPRFYVGKTFEGSEARLRHDMPDDLEQEMGDVARIEAHLARLSPIQRRWAGPIYHFSHDLDTTSSAVLITQENADVLRPHLEPWLPDIAMGRPAAAVLVDGHAVSVCASVRMTPIAHQAGVETPPEFRGRGHAVQAIRAWAGLLHSTNVMPLYSTSWENVASQAVARSLGLVAFGDDLHLT